MLSRDPGAAAAHMGRLIDRPAERQPDGALRVETGAGRADFVFLDRATLAKRHPGVAIDTLPDEGAVTLAVRVADVGSAAKAVGKRAVVATNSVVKVAPPEANGVILELLAG